MSVTQLTAWVRGNMGTTIKYVIGALTVAFALGGYVVKAEADNLDQDRRIGVLEKSAERQEDTAWNAWAACVANREKLHDLGFECRDPRGR